MRTLALLTALAAVATAVPALPGYNLGYRPAQYGLPTNFRREKKSPQTLLDPAPVEIAIDTSLDAEPEVFARTIALKKPIIIKKKHGYHLYRDSDEEQAHADPQERCNKEVKVKLCDAEHMVRSSDLMRAAKDTETISENDMETSIKLAKEAVENLQKITKFQSRHLGSEDEVREDIETARQALEHIQQNFGNLESMNVHAATLSDSEALHNARFTIANTESERMVQWKEAINNIQKNAEIARNIEDSFSTTNLMAGAVTEETDGKPKEKSSESNQNKQLEISEQLKAFEEKETNQKIDTTIKRSQDQIMKAASEQEMKLQEISNNFKESNTETMKTADLTKIDQALAPSTLHMTTVPFEQGEAKESKLEKSDLKEITKTIAKSSEHISKVNKNKMESAEVKLANSEIDATMQMKSSELSSKQETLQAVDEPMSQENQGKQHMKSTENQQNERMETSKQNNANVMKSFENKNGDAQLKSVELSNQNFSENQNVQVTSARTENSDNSAMASQLTSVDKPGEHEKIKMKSAPLDASDNDHLDIPLKEHSISGVSSFTKSVNNNEHAENLKAATIDALPKEQKDGDTRAQEIHQMKSAEMHTSPSNQVEIQLPHVSFKTAEQGPKDGAAAAEDIHQMKSAEMQTSPSNQVEFQLPQVSFKPVEHGAKDDATTTQDLHQMKSAEMETSPSNQVELQLPQNSFKTADHGAKDGATSSVQDIQQMKSAEMQTSPSNQVELQFPQNSFKTADHGAKDGATSSAQDIHQMKSAEMQTSPSNQVESQLLPFVSFKATEHEESGAAMKAAKSESQVAPVLPNELNAAIKEADSKNQFSPGFIAFRTTEQHENSATKASETTKMHQHEGFHTQGKAWHMDQQRTNMDFERAPQPQSQMFGPQMSGPHFFGSPIRNQHMMHHHGSPMGFHQRPFSQGFKAAEADSAVQATSEVNVNAASKSALEQSRMMQWKQKEAARGAYGSSAGLSAGAAGGAGGASGAGALGVFPGAKLGNCGIPLLVSCSPSVVSGSLTSSSYSAPHAYRSANDFSGRFPMKRDTKKTNDFSIKVKRAPSKVIQKIPLAKKL